MYGVLDELDIEGLKNLCHEDFVYLDKYAMITFNDYFALHSKQYAENPIDFLKNRNTIVDDRDQFSFQFTQYREEVPHRITNLSLLKDVEFWRCKLHRVPV